MMEQGIVFEALRRGLITPEQAKDKLSSPTQIIPPPLPSNGGGDDSSPPPGAVAGPNTTTDVAKSFGSGLARGIPNAIDMAGAVVAKGADYALDKSGVGNALGMRTGVPFSDYANGGGLNTAVDAAVGPRYQPQTTAGKYANAAGQGIAGSVLAPLEAATIPLAAAKTAAVGLGSGLGGQAGGDIGEAVGGDTGRIIGATVGSLAGGNPRAALEATGAPAAARAVGEAVTPQVAKETATLAKRASDFGIPLTVQQVAPSTIRNTTQKVSAAIPLSGVNKFEDTQRAAFNKALAGTIGETADALTPDTIKSYLNRSSEGFDGVLKGQTIQVGEDAVKSLDGLVNNAKDSITGDLADIVGRNVEKLKADITDGTISGDKLASFRSELVKRAANAQSGAKEYLGDLVDEIDDLAEKGLGSDAVGQLKTLRREYRNYKTVEPLLEKSPNGMINPTDLQQKVASSKFIKASRTATGDDDLVDLARIGKQLLPKLGGSDTFEKASLVGQGAGLATAVANPILGAKILGGVVLNRAFQSLYNQSPARINAIISKSLGSQADKAINMIKKGAPLSVVAQNLKKAGADSSTVDKTMSDITSGVVDVNPLPKERLTRRPIADKKTGNE